MPRIYTVSFENVTVSAIQDLLELTPAANKPCRLLAMKFGQHSDMGDAQEEGLRVSVKRLGATVTSGSGGSAPTPRLLDASGTGASFGAECNNTTPATSSGTVEVLLPISVNSRLGEEIWFPPELVFEFINGTALVVKMEAAPADAIAMSGCFWISEAG